MSGLVEKVCPCWIFLCQGLWWCLHRRWKVWLSETNIQALWVSAELLGKQNREDPLVPPALCAGWNGPSFDIAFLSPRESSNQASRASILSGPRWQLCLCNRCIWRNELSWKEIHVCPPIKRASNWATETSSSWILMRLCFPGNSSSAERNLEFLLML